MLALTLLFVLFGASIIATVVLPFLLPWPQQLRWMVITSQTPDPMRPGCWPSPVSLREVTVGDVDTRMGGVTVCLVPQDAPAEPLLRWVAATAQDLSCLRQWSWERAPLLLVTTPEGTQSLHSEVATVEGLRNVDFGVAFGETPVGIQ